ncbi:MAG: hypothetical protein ACUVRV_00770 [Cyanobacteriota bacterium]
MISWIDIRGLGSQTVMEQVEQIFGLHPLTLKDVVNVPQQPKVEEYEEYLIILNNKVATLAGSALFVGN